MESVRVVKGFNVISDCILGMAPCWPGMTVYEFGLERTEKTLGDGVVPAVSATAHRTDDTVVVEYVLITLGRVLDTAIRVMKQTSLRAHVVPKPYRALRVRAQS